jgi:hypothetical protein
MRYHAESVFRSILTLELLLIFLLIFLQISGFVNHPAPPVSITPTTPRIINATGVPTPKPTPTSTPTGWYYDPEKGYYVKGSDK